MYTVLARCGQINALKITHTSLADVRHRIKLSSPSTIDCLRVNPLKRRISMIEGDRAFHTSEFTCM